MAVNSNLALLITAQDKTSGPMRKVQRQVKDLSKSVDKLGKSFQGISAGNIATALGFTAMGAATAGVGLQFDMLKENAELAFGTLLKDGAKGKAFLEDLQNFALKTPFELEGLVDASRKLLGFGFAAQDVIPILQDVGDAVGAMGGGAEMVDRITTALGQMQTKGKASSEELMQLAEAGIPVWDILRQNVDELFGSANGQKFRDRTQSMIDSLVAQGTPLADAQAQAQTAGTQSLMKMISGGKLSSTKVIAALRKGMQARFGGLGEKQAATMTGELSNLSDAWKSLMGDMVKGAFGPGKTAIEGLTDLLSGLRGTINTLPDSFKQVLGIGTVLAGGVGALGGLSGGLGGVGGVLGSLFGSGSGGNPMVPLLLAIAIAIGLLMLPLQSILTALGNALHVLVDNWPSGGGGGGFPGGGAVPAFTAPLMLVPDHDDAQRTIDAWPILLGKLGIAAPVSTTVQSQIDGWTLTKTLLLGVPVVGDVQRVLDAWPSLQKSLGLVLPDWTDVQRAIGRLPDFGHALQLTIPGWSVVQGLIDAWPTLQKALGLMPTAPEAIQGQIDTWADLTHKLGLTLPPSETPQSEIDGWADFMHKIGVVLPAPDVPQTDINDWPDFTHLLNLSLTSNNDLQQLINLWPKFEHSMDLQIPANAQVQEALNRYDLKLNVGMNISAPPAPTVPNTPGVGVIGPDGKPHGVAYYPDFPGGPAVAHQYAMGGIVPGPLGAAQLAMVHGGEEITPAGRAGGAGRVVHFNNYGMLAGQDAERWLRGMLDKIERKGL